MSSNNEAHGDEDEIELSQKQEQEAYLEAISDDFYEDFENVY
jgi:hypothetical protein